MKKTLMVLVLGAALIAAQTQNAQAQRWVAPAVIGGLVTGAVIADALQPRPVYYAAPAYCPPATTVYYTTPGQSVYYSTPAPAVAVAAPAPAVVYAPAPVYYPAPVVRVGFGWGWGWGWHHRDHDRR